MGYRSDVVIAFQFDDKDDLVAFATKLKFSGNEEIKKAFKEYRYTQAKTFDCTNVFVMYAHFESVKWYRDYPDVEAHIHILNDAAEHKAATLYLVVGKDIADLEQREDGFDNCKEYILTELFSIERYIQFDVNVDDIPINEL